MAQWFRSFAAESTGAPADTTTAWTAAEGEWLVVNEATHERGAIGNLLSARKSDAGGTATYAGLYFDLAPQSADQEVLIECYLAGDGFAWPPGVVPVVRMSSTAGYLGGAGSGGGNFLLDRIAASDSAENSVGGDGVTLNNTDPFRIRLRADSGTNTISLRMWNATGAEPGTWGHTWVNSGLTASGFAGIMVRQKVFAPFHVAFIGVGTAGDTAPSEAPASGPVLTAGDPAVTSITQTGATVNYSTDTAGTAYIVKTTSATPPSAAQIKAGQNHTGAAAVYAANASVASGARSFTTSGGSASTLYYWYIILNDGTDDSNVLSGSFTTSAAVGATHPFTSVNIGG